MQYGESADDFSECQCGGQLKYEDSVEKSRYHIGLSSETIIRIAAVLFGSVIMFSPYYFASPAPSSATFVLNNTSAYLLWLGGGATAAFIAGGRWINGASNGLYSGIISGLLVIFIFFYLMANNFNNPHLSDNVAFFAALSVIYVLIPGILGIVGGLVGISLRMGLSKLM